MARIFISYKRADRPFLDKLLPKLRRAHGMDSVWFDEHIPGGVDWWKHILARIEQCDVFIYLLSNDSLHSPYCISEFREALRLKKHYIPVVCRLQTEIPDTLPEGVKRALNRTQRIVIVDTRGEIDVDAMVNLNESIREMLVETTKREDVIVPENTEAIPEPIVDDFGAKKPFWQQINEPQAIIIAAIIGLVGIIIAALIQPSTPSTVPISTFPSDSTVQEKNDDLINCSIESFIISSSSPALLDDSYPIGTSILINGEGSCRESIRASKFTINGESYAEETNVSTRSMALEVDQEELEICFLITNATWDFAASECKTVHGISVTPLSTSAIDYPLAFNGTSNADWIPVERDFDGITMVLVPAGCFMMGRTNGNIYEQPVHPQCFEEPFWIDQTEVTNAAYGSLGCTELSSEPNQPRNCVNWFSARSFCETRGGRLPTEAEWEYAARGPEEWLYPWGNTFIEENVVFSQNSSTRPAVVGSRISGASWVGAYDMLGNLGEWTSSLFQDYPYDKGDGREDVSNTDPVISRVWRGGSFVDHPYFLLTTNRYRGGQGDGDRYGGFRCVRPY